MKNTNAARGLFFGIASLLVSTVVSAQGGGKPSPAATAGGVIHGDSVTISYSSPSVKGRQIWGGLVPYNKPWRAGANQATIFYTAKAIQVEGKSLPAGKYSLFATPGEKEWTIILNSETGQWGIKRGGDANFDPAKNVLSVVVKPKKSAVMNEKLTYEITASGFVLRWENIEVPVAIK